LDLQGINKDAQKTYI